jgi:hypothetical protein
VITDLEEFVMYHQRVHRRQKLVRRVALAVALAACVCMGALIALVEASGRAL